MRLVFEWPVLLSSACGRPLWELLEERAPLPDLNECPPGKEGWGRADPDQVCQKEHFSGSPSSPTVLWGGWMLEGPSGVQGWGCAAQARHVLIQR